MPKKPFFGHKISALRKGVEVGLNTIAPRERASNYTSRTTRPGVENARLHRFAGTNVAKNRPKGPILGDFCATENAITR